VYALHEALAAVREARDRGIAAFAETCPQYLFLDSERYEGNNFEGAKYVCSPPIRPKWHQEHLWRGLALGDLQVVSTDHCPFCMKDQKILGQDDFSKIPNGMPGIETRLFLLYQGVREKKLTLNRFVDIVATTPAKLFGLYPRKGTIAAGSDADVLLWDPEREVSLNQETLHMRVDYSAYEGVTVKGGPAKVFSRGELLVDDGKFVSKPGRGSFIKRAAREG